MQMLCNALRYMPMDATICFYSVSRWKANHILLFSYNFTLNFFSFFHLAAHNSVHPINISTAANICAY